MQNILFHSSGFHTIYNVHCAWDGRAWAEIIWYTTKKIGWTYQELFKNKTWI